MDTEKIMKRTVKDSVFTNLFQQPEYLIQLYKVLHPEDTSATENDIENVMKSCSGITMNRVRWTSE